ncbi:hypothetical protein V1514DRAFT_328297 [Lipomyces japonicus]|uniref:uncharacterized protein n=1 Tax=Lipomyces japonicus TaxID=56871 RepID=UPI0034D0145B
MPSSGSLDVFSINIGYPVYAAAFASDSTLIVAGGGGEGKNGVANKISVLEVESSEGQIKIETETVLSKEEDAPMSLDVARADSSDTSTLLIAVGVNESSAQVCEGKNEHLRLFQVETDARVELFDRRQVFKREETENNDGDDEDPAKKNKTLVDDEFQKLTRFSSSPAKFLALLSSSGKLVNLAFPGLDRQFEPVVTNDIQDVAFSTDETLLAFTTPKSVTLLLASTGEKIAEYSLPSQLSSASFRGVRFAGEDSRSLVLIANHARRTGASVVKLVVPADIDFTKQQALPPSRPVVGKLHSGIKAVTALDARAGLACVAGADLSVSVVAVDSLKVLKRVRAAHTFAITQVVINPSATAVASTSVAQSVVVIRLDGAAARKSSNRHVLVTTTVVSVVVILLIAVIVQMLVQRQVLGSLGGTTATSLRIEE